MDVEARTDSLWRPLHSQAYRGHLAGVELLLEHGADIEAKTSFGHTPLFSSLRWDRIEVTKFLIEKGADLNPTTELGRTPLITASIEGNAELARLLIDNNADTGVRDYNYQRTALHFAALYGQLDIVDALVKKDAKINEKDGAGKTALDYACRYGHEKVAKLLKSAGAEGKTDPRHFGFSPFVSPHGRPGSGFLIEADGLVIFFGGKHLLFNESQREAFHKPIDTLKNRGQKIDLLILQGNFALGRIFPENLEGVDYAVKTLKPKAILVSGGDSTEFVLLEVAAALEKYKDHTKVFCPEHRGDMFLFINLDYS